MMDEALRDRTESDGINNANPEAGSPSDGIPTDEQPPQKSIWRRRITLISGLTVLLAAALVLPPLINVGRYQRQVTALMSRSLGRPVHLSGVEVRLLPRPGFVLHDLTVGEDAAFGAEGLGDVVRQKGFDADDLKAGPQGLAGHGRAAEQAAAADRASVSPAIDSSNAAGSSRNVSLGAR